MSALGMSLFLFCFVGQSQAQTYEANWESLGNYQTPEWYQDAKFGIWPHWGVYSVPAYRGTHAAEWYPRWMHSVEKGPKTILKKRSGDVILNDFYDSRGLKTAEHHREKYGEVKDFAYHDFIDQWKAEKFDADEWAEMTQSSGAKFFCMMAQHHDSFSLYDSDHTKFDSVDMGPKRDLCMEMKKAVNKKGLKFGVSNHLAFNASFFAFYHNNGYAKLPGHDKYTDLYSKGVVDDEYMDRWWKRTTEAVDKLQPDLYYFDWGWDTGRWPEENYHQKFASYYYNAAVDQKKGGYGNPGVVLCSKSKEDPSNCVTRDLERGGMGSIQSNVWQTDTSISVHSWGYAEDDEYFSPTQLLHTLIDVVSKNGVMMLNFGPKADGTVPEEYKKRLLAMGKWLGVCGESIYATRPFVRYGENRDKSVASSQKIRFTRSKDNKVLFAIAMNWPGETLTLRTLDEKSFDTSGIDSVRLLGTDEPLQWKQDAKGFHVEMPEDPGYGHAYPVRIEFAEQIPGK